MRTKLNVHTDQIKTVRQVLPYRFQLMPNGKMTITNWTELPSLPYPDESRNKKAVQ